jgi:hypothetical protein
MAKGAFFPELLQLHVYARDASEIQRFLLQLHDDLFAPVMRAAEEGLPCPAVPFRSRDYSLNEVVAIGSLIHEYVHYLQYTTRNLGLLFYESRYGQYQSTGSCLKELKTLNKGLRLPLIAWFEDEGSSAPAPLTKWREEWGAYQAAIATIGLGPPVGWDSAFNAYVRREFHDNWFPMTRLEQHDGTVVPIELSVGRLLETEADIVVITLLGELFPEMCDAACQELLGPPDPVQRSFALPLMYSGLTYVVPVIADYAMQLPFHTNGKLRSASAVFADMLGVVKDRYAGMSLKDTMGHRDELIKTISDDLGVMPLDVAVRTAVTNFKRGDLHKTGFGKMLLSSMRFRSEHPLLFLAPAAFLPCVLTSLPASMWVCYNEGILDGDRSRMELFHGRGVRKGREEFEVIFLRYLLWACREIAIRPRRYICPQCQINARWPHCSGECGFVSQCEAQLGINPARVEWII